MTLEQWLYTATQNLVPKAAQKVREDIEFHVETAMRRYQIEGKSELEATEFAIRDLGYPKVAARGFEKTYLTKSELNLLASDQETIANKIWLSIPWFVAFIYVTITNFSHSVEFWNLQPWQFSVFTFIITIQFLINGIIARKYSLKTYIMPRILITTFYFLCYAVTTIWNYSTFEKLNQVTAKYGWITKTYEFIGGTKLTEYQIEFTVGTAVLILFGASFLYLNYSRWRKLRFL